MKSYRYAIITPAYNEARFLPDVITSIANQKSRPVQWIIVDDRSTDRTNTIAMEAASEYDFIDVLKLSGKQERSLGANVVSVFNAGLAQLRADVDFVIKMDADVVLPANYFHELIQRFHADARLGIASGKLYTAYQDKWILERCPDFHAVGPCKMYRMECFHDIGGLITIYGWDILDCVKARMRGWEARSFDDLHIKHLRMMGSEKGMVRGHIGHGRGMYAIRAHPLFVIARSIYRAFEHPYLTGLFISVGYLYGGIKGDKRLNDAELVKFLRKEQLGRLMGKKLKQENLFSDQIQK